MEAVCLSCHGRSWVRGHFERYEKSHETTNAATRTATALLEEAWARGYARVRRTEAARSTRRSSRWADIWLFYANSIRFTAAIAGGGDYAVFADGHYTHAKRIKEMQESLEERTRRIPDDPGASVKTHLRIGATTREAKHGEQKGNPRSRP